MTATLGIKLEKREREWRDTFDFGRIGGGSMEIQCSGNFLESMREALMRTLSNAIHRV